MISLEFSAETLARTRFSVSPAMEAVSWLKLAATARRHPIFGDPGPVARGALRHPDVALVADLLPTGSVMYQPDLLTPKPTRGPWRKLLDAQVAEIEAIGQSELHTQACTLVETYWGRPVSDRVRRLAESGHLQKRLAAGVERFWRETLDDNWPALQAALENDIVERSKTIAMQGIGRALDGLSPRVRWTGDSLSVDKPSEGVVDLREHELVLAATALSWPGIMVQVDDAAQATLYYPANQLGTGGRPGPAELTEVVGAVRAALLGDLGAPRSTTELAARHGMAPSTVSHHLGALHRARLVGRQRSGRYVHYQRTERGDALLEFS